MRTILSNDNSKLGKIPTMFLPAKKTCPGSTPSCRQACYGCRGKMLCGNVKKKHAWNLLQSKMENFTDRIIAETYAMTFDIKRFRLNSTGDFYNQKYLNSWKKIARKFPDVKFMGYTTSGKLNFSRLPKNMILYYSEHDDTKIPRPKHIKRTAKILYKNMERKPGMNICPGSCITCSMCWDLPENSTVYFPKH